MPGARWERGAVVTEDDWTITVEVKRHDGETWVRGLIDGAEVHDEPALRALIERVMPGLVRFCMRGDSAAEGD